MKAEQHANALFSCVEKCPGNTKRYSFVFRHRMMRMIVTLRKALYCAAGGAARAALQVSFPPNMQSLSVLLCIRIVMAPWKLMVTTGVNVKNEMLLRKQF